jgi:predicted RNase H-like nuclease (RuvC/YqgF family)
MSNTPLPESFLVLSRLQSGTEEVCRLDETMAYAAAVSAELRADNIRLQNEVVMPLREQVKELEETNRKCVFAVGEYNKAIQHLDAEVRRLNEALRSSAKHQSQGDESRSAAA